MKSSLRTALKSNPRVVFGSTVLLAMIALAALAPWLAPHDPLDQDLINTLLPPAWLGGERGFLLGTDSLGRDILSRLIYGARVALTVAVVAALLAGLLGSVLGLLAGYFGGWVDTLISRVVDIWMSFPAVLLSIVLAAVLGAGLHTVVIAIVVIDWTRFCRVVRSEVLVQREQDYVASAVTIGLAPGRILFGEVLPNVVPLLLTLFTLEMGIAIVVEAILSFRLGRGVWRGYLGRHDRGRPAIREPGLVADGSADVVRDRRSSGDERAGGRTARYARSGESPMSALLTIQNLHVAIGGAPILRGVALAVGPGRVLGLVGESGAGKTMVSRVVLGIQPGNARITGGCVEFEGRDITHLDGHQRRHLLGREIALVPQNPMTALNPVVRIEPQITDVLELHLGVSGGQAQARALELLQAVHLREPERVLRQYPHELSGGMRQRILIAIAFACKPKLIIADEPTTALDVTVQRQILGLLKALQRTSGTAVLFISHDLGVVSKICDDVCVITADGFSSRHPWRISSSARARIRRR
jgi:peptide/nickel transport system permease protein